MANRPKADPGQPDITDELRRCDQPTPDAPATVPHPCEEVPPDDPRPAEDGGVAQHPIHDSDVEDLEPEDYEEMTDQVQDGRIVHEP